MCWTEKTRTVPTPEKAPQGSTGQSTLDAATQTMLNLLVVTLKGKTKQVKLVALTHLLNPARQNCYTISRINTKLIGENWDLL